LDFALPAVLVSVAACAEHGAMVLDGSANDKYMHYSPSRRDRFLRAISVPSRFGGLGWGAAWLPGLSERATYVASSAGMYANERWFPGIRLSARLIRQLTGSADAAQAFARSLDLALRDCHVVDAVTMAKARYSDYSGGMEKTRLAAEQWGLSAAYPFCDNELIEYYFNLPNGLRFDEQTFEAKIAFKEWLRHQSVRSQYFEVKGSFRYDLSAMFRENYQAVIDMMINSRNVEFTPKMHRIFERARYGYFSAQQAYLIFSLTVWADFHGFTLDGAETQNSLSPSS
jgi:hypothetical protein